MRTAARLSPLVERASCLFGAFALLLLSDLALPACVSAQEQPAQTPPAPRPPAQKPPEAAPAKKPPVGPAAPQSTHYPILLLGFGTSPEWSVRIGQKGPERLDRANYPPIPLEAAEVTHETAADTWTYHAKDLQTGAAVAVHISREGCIDGAGTTRYTFRASVEHAQIGTLNGCARIAAELFPKITNQTADDEDTDKDKNKPPPPTITNFKTPTAVAYLNASQQLVFKRGLTVRIAATQKPLDFSVSHDGKKLLYTRSDSKTDASATIVLYDFDTHTPKDLIHGLVRQAFWSPDDMRVAYLKMSDGKWQVWTASVAAPDAGAALSPGVVTTLEGWIDQHTLLAADQQDVYWLSEDKPQQTVPLKEIYGDVYQIADTDAIRVHPLNPDLLLVSAVPVMPTAGSNGRAGAKLPGLFLYELRSKRRVPLTPPDQSARNGEWSRDGLQVFFTGIDVSKRSAVFRIFWDGTSVKRMLEGSQYVVGQ